ncbi:MAG: hypothetical protein J7M34_03965, partial [Anaerolineae bacterium]|nr:hypothetical protein [Anaerolineae bacterium]
MDTRTESGANHTPLPGAREPSWPRSQQLLVLISLLVIVGIIALAPGNLLDRADRVGYAVCHQILDRRYVIGGRPLPLCARCSG